MKTLLLLLLICISIQIGESQVTPVLINCGSNSSITLNGRTWIGDDQSRGNNFTLTGHGISGSSEEKNQANLYKTARIFNTSSSYNFSAVSGTYSLRLHFASSSYANISANASSFDVLANNMKLVSKFSVPEEISWKQEVSDWNSSFLVKEYFLTVKSSLSVQFVPEESSFAFVNAIELIPVVDELFVDSAREVDSGKADRSYSLSEHAIETMYRLNVGGDVIKSSLDSALPRDWDSDERYMFSANAANVLTNTSNISYVSPQDSYAAPLYLYESAKATTNNQVVDRRFNMSWRFPVDPNFDYLIRLHFCELYYDKPNQRVFKIYINNRTAAENYDVYLQAKGKNKAYHEDFVDTVSQSIDTLWIQLGPDSVASTAGTDALLNGLEIFKLSRNGNLAHVLRRVDVTEEPNKQKSKSKIFLIALLAIAIVTAILIVITTCICIYMRKRRVTDTKQSTLTNLRASVTTRNGRVFSLSTIKAATNNFDESLVIGTGGFGKVFKGEIDGVPVAIKRANPQSQQGLKEFETEIEMLSKLRHRHLVSMIGYCDQANEMILVYEYMANGTLRGHLFGGDHPPLSWRQRLEACIGAARGLHYLHTGAERGIIHRDVKTTNILLDEGFIAKMADFGLSKDGPALDQTHVSTAVKGSFGYLDPEYFMRQQLTEKSDVYSFGVVLFEVLCARAVIDPTLPREEVNLAEWAMRHQRRGCLGEIVDGKMDGGCTPEMVRRFGEIAEKCLAEEGKDRPAMGDVLWKLEGLLQEVTASGGSHDDGGGGGGGDHDSSLPVIGEGEEDEI